MTFDEIEAREVAACATCEVPFGLGNKKWLELKSLALPGDCVIAFDYSAGKVLAMGSRGYALVRGQVLVKQVITFSE